MLGEIGIAWRPKTRPKNKLRLNMKKLLNPKLAKKKITVIEDSSSQEELEEIRVLIQIILTLVDEWKLE